MMRTIIVRICLGATVVLVLCFFAAVYPKLLRSAAVRKLLDNPTGPLSDQEHIRIAEYVRGATALSTAHDSRSRRLVDAAIERAVVRGKPAILLWIAQRRAADGSFPTLPAAAAEVINKCLPGSDLVFDTVACDGRPNELDQHVDVEAVLASGDSMLILSVLAGLRMRALLIHKRACLEVLRREDIRPASKIALLQRIITEKVAPKWFAASDEILDSLRSSGDRRLMELAERISATLRHVEDKGIRQDRRGRDI